MGILLNLTAEDFQNMRIALRESNTEPREKARILEILQDIGESYS